MIKQQNSFEEFNKIKLDQLPLKKWINWQYTKDHPWPQLDGDPLLHVKYLDGEDSVGCVYWPKPLSWFHGDGEVNFFEWTHTPPKRNYEIVAFMIVDTNDRK